MVFRFNISWIRTGSNCIHSALVLWLTRLPQAPFLPVSTPSFYTIICFLYSLKWKLTDCLAKLHWKGNLYHAVKSSIALKYRCIQMSVVCYFANMSAPLSENMIFLLFCHKIFDRFLICPFTFNFAIISAPLGVNVNYYFSFASKYLTVVP